MTLRNSPERRALPAVLALLLVPALLAAQDGLTGPVGAVGDPKLLRFEGNSAFSADEVREALVDDWAVQLASTPSASLRDYVRLLPLRLAEGCRASGFPDVTATADLLPDRAGILLRIKEGTRYPCGEVRVHNAKGVDAALLARTLTTLPPQERWPARFGLGSAITVTDAGMEPENTRVPWTPGQPGPFDATTAKSIPSKVAQALAEQGFFWPEYAVKVRPDGNKCILQIDLEKEGPKAVLGEIQITGLQRNSREDLLEAVGAHVGMPLDLRTLRGLQHKLWSSGRFSEHTVMVQPATNAGEAKLLIALREIEGLPLLNEPLSATEQALLRFHEWVESLALSDEDLVFEMNRPDMKLRAAIGRRSGMALRLSSTQGGGCAYGIVATPKHVGTYVLHQKRKFTGAPGDHRLRVLLRASTFHEPRENRTRSRFLVGGGLVSKPEGQPSQPFETWIQAYPSAALLTAHDPRTQCELAAGTLTVSSEGTTLAIDAATGRLLALRMAAGPDGQDWRLSAEKNAVQREMDRLEAEVTATNEYDPKRPLGSFLAFHSEQLLGVFMSLSPQYTREQRDHACKAVAKLFSPELFGPVDALAARSGRPKAERLHIPLSPELLPLSAQPSSMFAMALPWCNDLFARESWPWVVSRETLLMLGGMSRYSVQELMQLERSDQLGPVGCLAAAMVLRQANLTLSRTFAFRGLDLLSADAFARDRRVLLHGDSPQAQILRSVAANVRALSAEEAAIISQVVNEPYGPLLQRLHQVLQPQKDKPINDAIEAITRDYWTGHLRPVVERHLRQLTKPPQPAGGKL